MESYPLDKCRQVGITKTYSPLSSILWNDHHVRQLIRILHFSYELDSQQLVHLRLDDLLPVRWKRRTFWLMGSEKDITLS